MPTAENAELQYESGQTTYPMEALTDSGDMKTFDSSAVYFSGASGKEPNIKPDGIATGGVIGEADSGSNDVVDVAAITCYLAGVLTSVSAGVDIAIARASTDVASISSVTINSSGAIAVVKGTDSSDATFSETRAAAGGPPLIPVGSIEVGQVRTTTNVAAVICCNDILQVVGTHQERYDYPVWTIDSKEAQVIMADTLPSIHTGPLPKAINASYSDPIFSKISLASDFVPSENSHTVNSQQIYGTTIGSTSKSLNQGSFTAYLNDGITDPLVKAKDDNLFFKFKQDKLKAPYILDQGILGMARAFPAGDSLSSACTISPSSAATSVEA